MALHVGKRRFPLKRRRSVGHIHYAKERRHSVISVALISTIILLVLVTGAGFVYAWYSGQVPVKQPAVVATKEETPTVVKNPIKPKRVTVGVATQYITSPVAPGEEASVSIHTSPLATCSIAVEYDEVPVTDQNLKPQHADEYGVVVWDWIVDANAPLGEWPIEVTCAYQKESGVGAPILEIAYPKQAG